MNQKFAIGAALAGAAALGALAVAYSNAQTSSGEFSPSQEDAIKEIVRQYIVDHPDEVLDAVNSYISQRQIDAAAESKKTAEQYARDNLSELLDDRHGFAAGANPAAAQVAVVEFFDYHCGFCKRSTPFVKELTKSDPAVKVVFREYPILREESEYAAEAALASRAQGKYTEFHFAMMNASGLINKERAQEIAKSVGIDLSALDKEIQNPDIKKAIDETHRITSEMAVDGTPTFIVASLNGKYVEVIQGADTDGVKAAIAEAKKAAKKG